MNSRYKPLKCFFTVVTKTANGTVKVYGNSVSLRGNAMSVFAEMQKLEATKKWLERGEKVLFLKDVTLGIKYNRESLEVV